MDQFEYNIIHQQIETDIGNQFNIDQVVELLKQIPKSFKLEHITTKDGLFYYDELSLYKLNI